MNSLMLLIVAAMLIGWQPAVAESYTEYFEKIVSSREGVRTPTWIIEPGNPKVAVILFAGGGGNLKITSDGIKRTNNFLIRSRNLFADHGFVVAVVDKPTDQKNLRGFRVTNKYALDIGSVISFLKKKYSLDVWLAGTSRGTIAATNVAARLKESGPKGLVLTATVTLPSNRGGDSIRNTELKIIHQPVLFVHHKKDGCYVSPYKQIPKVIKKLKLAKKVELLSFEGGKDKSSNACQAKTYHGFLGIEEKVVSEISDWITKN